MLGLALHQVSLSCTFFLPHTLTKTLAMKDNGGGGGGGNCLGKLISIIFLIVVTLC